LATKEQAVYHCNTPDIICLFIMRSLHSNGSICHNIFTVALSDSGVNLDVTMVKLLYVCNRRWRYM
jgi:hypothetical protein